MLNKISAYKLCDINKKAPCNILRQIYKPSNSLFPCEKSIKVVVERQTVTHFFLLSASENLLKSKE